MHNHNKGSHWSFRSFPMAASLFRDGGGNERHGGVGASIATLSHTGTGPVL